jgi:hypothetical protein
VPVLLPFLFELSAVLADVSVVLLVLVLSPGELFVLLLQPPSANPAQRQAINIPFFILLRLIIVKKT